MTVLGTLVYSAPTHWQVGTNHAKYSALTNSRGCEFHTHKHTVFTHSHTHTHTYGMFLEPPKHDKSVGSQSIQIVRVTLKAIGLFQCTELVLVT